MKSYKILGAEFFEKELDSKKNLRTIHIKILIDLYAAKTE